MHESLLTFYESKRFIELHFEFNIHLKINFYGKIFLQFSQVSYR